MAENALESRGVTKKFGDIVALDSVDLVVKAGETHGLLGPNGAGKSTLINILSGVLRPDSGEITFLGRPYTRPTVEFRMSIGVIPQEISLYEKLTARENLEFYGNLYGMDAMNLKKEIGEALELVGLKERQNDRIETYSGGMKRRINIAASILHNPEFIMMDEPTVGIDPQSRNLIFEVIEKLHEKGITIIYTSHYMEEVERLCQKITILDHGRIIADGTRNELVSLVSGVDTLEIELDETRTVPSGEILEGELKSMEPRLVDGKLILKTENGSEKLSRIINVLSGSGAGVKRINVREPNLETVFLYLTGKGLRD